MLNHPLIGSVPVSHINCMRVREGLRLACSFGFAGAYIGKQVGPLGHWDTDVSHHTGARQIPNQTALVPPARVLFRTGNANPQGGG